MRPVLGPGHAVIEIADDGTPYGVGWYCDASGIEIDDNPDVGDGQPEECPEHRGAIDCLAWCDWELPQ